MKPSSRKLAITAITALLMIPTTAWGIVINEIRIDQPGADSDEYFELAGNPGESLNGLSYLVIGDSAGGGSGVIEEAINLAGLNIPDDGYFLAAQSSYSLGGLIDLIASLNFENGDNVTHLLVSGLTGATNHDLDTDDDGVLDITPWDLIIDSIALLDSTGSGEWVYSAATVGPDGSAVPGHVFRSPDLTGAWQIGQFDPVSGDGTPGVAQIPEPISIALLGIGLIGLSLTRYRHSGP